jgi:hypothetical protein
MGTNGHELSPGGTISGGPLENAPDPISRRRSETTSDQTYGLTTRRLGTKHLYHRSAIAVAVRRFKAELTADLGGDSHRAQETVGEVATRNSLTVEALDDWLLRQPPLIMRRKQAVLPVLLQRQQLVDSVARLLERIGLERKARELLDLQSYLAAKQPPATDGAEHRAEPTGGWS